MSVDRLDHHPSSLSRPTFRIHNGKLLSALSSGKKERGKRGTLSSVIVHIKSEPCSALYCKVQTRGCREKLWGGGKNQILPESSGISDFLYYYVLRTTFFLGKGAICSDRLFSLLPLLFHSLPKDAAPRVFVPKRKCDFKKGVRGNVLECKLTFTGGEETTQKRHLALS